MSRDPASPSGSSHRSFPTVHRAPDTVIDLLPAESSASAAKTSERRDPKPKLNLQSVPRQRSSGLQRRGDKSEQGHYGIGVSTRDRTSAGFLLDSGGDPSYSAYLSGFKNDRPDLKGKSKRDGSGLMATKRRSRDSYRSSIGSSPLATKVTTLDDDAEVHAGSPSQGGSSMYAPKSQYEPQTVGYDTDPVQIVNLALSLSEGRRRQVSGMRIASGDTGIRRSISTSHGTDLRGTRLQGGIGQFLHSERQFSRNLSPQTDDHGHTAAGKTFSRSTGMTPSYLQSVAADESDTGLRGGLYDISDITFTRVQRAKDHFELLYEHRRLLAHLPPLRGPAQSAPKWAVEGRVYNPLQYVRNRKVRFQEKKPIESDAEGWHDVQQVRAWVSAIIEGHSEPRTDPNECIRLPELHHLRTATSQEHIDPDACSQSAIAHKRDISQSTKPRRPRSDWVVSPGDLLADVYWLEQGLNKTKIEDRDGNKIYPGDVELKHTSVQSGNPTYRQGSQHPPHPPKPADSSERDLRVPSAPPELPTFTSTGRKRRQRGRGRHRERKRSPGSESDDSDRETRRSKRLRKGLIRSRSRSSTSDSDEGKIPRPPIKAGKEDDEDYVTESGALEYYMRKMMDRNGKHFSAPSAANNRPSSMERSRSLTKDYDRYHSRIASSRERSSSQQRKEFDPKPRSPQSGFGNGRKSRTSLEIQGLARASFDDDTAPSSPSIHQFPSIAIDLSPPPSRSPSPKKKVLHSRINPFRDRNQSKQRSGIETTDFAEAQALASSRQRRIDTDRESTPFEAETMDPSPVTKVATRTSDTSMARGASQRARSTVFKPSAGTLNPPDTASRIRGMFKGGRIAELVGHEVSRVGDFVWKRDPPSTTRTTSSAASAKSQYLSDTEEEVHANGIISRTQPQPEPVSGSVPPPVDPPGRNSPPSQYLSHPEAGDKPLYFMNNLPSFTSPSQKDREVQQQRQRKAMLTPESSPPTGQMALDHISRAAAHHRTISKSPRLDRLAPPKLNTSQSNSPAGSPKWLRRGGYDSGLALAVKEPTSATLKFNDALGRSRGAFPVTGLSGLKASRSVSGRSRNWGPSAQDISPERESTAVTKKDIARARALLLSSGAKARQISLRAHSIRPQIPQFLLDSVDSPSAEALQSLRVPRKDEHCLAARNLASRLTAQSATFHTSLDHFTCTTCPSLHTSLQALDDLVENTLTPRVRAAADESGELSMKLTTTSTLAVKGLSDVIEGAMRRRRRGPVRWLRRFGYGIVEWMVVGLLWGIWLVVSVVKVAVGIIRGTYRAVRWLFWID